MKLLPPEILRLKCTKFDFGWGSAPDPAGRAYSPLDPIAGFKGAYTSKRREENGREGGERERRGGRGKGTEGRKGKRQGREGKDPHCFLDKSNPERKAAFRLE